MTYSYTYDVHNARQDNYVDTLTDEYQKFIFSSLYPYVFTNETVLQLQNSLSGCEIEDGSIEISLDKMSLSFFVRGVSSGAYFEINAFSSSYFVHYNFSGYASITPLITTVNNTTKYLGNLVSTDSKYIIDNDTVRFVLISQSSSIDITRLCYDAQNMAVNINMPKILSQCPAGDIYVYANTKLRRNDSDIVDSEPIDELIRYSINNNISQQQFRICVLYPDETINYEIPNEDIRLGGSYNENYQNGQRRTLSFSLYNEDGKYTPNINTFWAGTRLRLDVGIKTLNDKIYWYQNGIFIINSITPSTGASSKMVDISAGDKFSLFEGAIGKLTSTYEIPYDTDIESIILDILHTNMGNGYLLDPQECIFNSAFRGKKTQVAISKSPGDTLGSILLDIASQLSAEIYYNENGNLVLVPINETTADKDKPLLFSFSTDNGDMAGLNFNFDYNAIVNKIIVIGTSSSGGTFTAEAVNSDPGSPLCYQRIGYRVGDIINDSNIYSQELAQERAEYELRQQLILKSSTSASIVFNPLLKVNNIITISDQFFNLKRERFLLQSISYSLNYSNQMSITFSNLNNLPFAIG